LKNPVEERNSKKLSENFRDCKNTNAGFVGDIPELDGYLYIEGFDNETCFISYRSDLTMDCNYPKDQMRVTYEETEKNNMERATGAFFYYGHYFEIQMRMLGELLKAKANETFGGIGNLTLGEDLMTEEIEREFENPVTGKKEIVKCLVY